MSQNENSDNENWADFLLNVCCVLVFYVFLCCSVNWFLYAPFGHGALKLGISTLFTTFLLSTLLQLILAASSRTCHTQFAVYLGTTCQSIDDPCGVTVWSTTPGRSRWLCSHIVLVLRDHGVYMYVVYIWKWSSAHALVGVSGVASFITTDEQL